MRRGNLTTKRIEKLPPGRYHDGNGLYLQILSPTNKSWLMRFEYNGRERWLGLGGLRLFPLAAARKRRDEAQRLLADGVDPIARKHTARAERRQQEATVRAHKTRRKTFAECAAAFLAAHEAEWTNAKHRQQWSNTLRDYAHPVIGAMDVADITTPDIIRILERDELWATRRATARRTLSRVERVLNFAKASGYRAGDNPAAWSGHLRDLLPSKRVVEHHAALPYGEVPGFVAALRTHEGIAVRALEFIILTAARTGEVLGATLDEVDLAAKVWTVPAERMKADRQHRVPLAEPVLALLKALPREAGNPFVFIGTKKGRGLYPTSLAVALRRIRPDITTHGFRSTFRDWVAETTAYPNHVAEQALAHSIGSAVEKAYRRGDLFNKRRRLMGDWARYVTSGPIVIYQANTPVTPKTLIPSALPARPKPDFRPSQPLPDFDPSVPLSGDGDRPSRSGEVVVPIRGRR
jgi:integrase